MLIWQRKRIDEAQNQFTKAKTLRFSIHDGDSRMILIEEIVIQSKIAQRAAEHLRATYDNFDHIEIWCTNPSILVAAGNVSKNLWPNEKYKILGERG